MIGIDLKGHIAVVSGATGQIGRVICAKLAQAGCDVAVCYHHNREKAEEICTHLQMHHGVCAKALQADVCQKESVQGLKEQVAEQMGQPDFLINSAVIQYDWKNLLEQDEADYYSQFESCVMHSVHMIKAFVPGMIQKGYGRVIGINSECAMQCFEGQSAYAAGKRAMDGIYRVLAREVSRYGITVNEIAPGRTYSDKNREIGRATSKNYLEQVPTRRQNTDEDIANAVLFLASDLASSITGVYLPVCGGNVMPGI